MKHHKLEEFINELTATSIKYSGTQQLSSRLRTVVFKHLDVGQALDVTGIDVLKGKLIGGVDAQKDERGRDFLQK